MTTLLAWKRGADGEGAPPSAAHDEWIHGNNLFHLAIQDAAGNERLRATLADLHVSFPRDLTWIVLGESSRLLEENVAQHATILQAIEAHDPARARAAMVEHVHRAGELVTRRLEQRTE